MSFILTLALSCLISVEIIQALDLPILHPDCNEYEDASQPTQLPYPNDCTKFYKCSGGYAFTLNCPQGLHWSVKFDRCEFPAVADCRAGSGSSEILRTTTPPRTTVSPGVGGRDDDKGIIVLNCPSGENPEDPTHLPYPGDCRKFFKCEVGKARALSCPYGLHWSVVLNRCDWPEVAKCAKVVPTIPSGFSESTPTPAPTPATTTPPTPPPTSATTIAPTLATTQAPTPAPAPISSPVPSPTPAPTPSPTSAPTQPPTLASTTPRPAPTPAIHLSTTEVDSLCKDKVSAFISYPGNCVRYIRCVNGTGTIYSCPGNLFFNSKRGVCTRTCA